MVAMRRDVLQSRGWEGVWGHRADMLLVSGSQQSLHATSSVDNTRWPLLSVWSVCREEIRSPFFSPLPDLLSLGVAPDHPPAHVPGVGLQLGQGPL